MSRATADYVRSKIRSLLRVRSLTKFVQLKSIIKGLAENVAFYEASERELTNELAAALKDSTRLSQFFYVIRVEVVDLREDLRAKDGIIWSIPKDLCM